MCLLCSDIDELKKQDPRSQHQNTFATNLCSAPCNNPGCCCLAFFCPHCVAYNLRKRALHNDMTRYICCQGYLGSCCCFKPGEMGERSCPECCLCMEVCCCLGLSMSSTRFVLMDEYSIQPDICDYRLMCFSNTLQILSCICMIAGIFFPPLRSIARSVHHLARLVFMIILSCMAGQIDLELKLRSENGLRTKIVPGEDMKR
eukprot:c8855_g1_i1.p1 GENE.c8855_g1_i1~~c8855_g1_i1.p1  ORF type:complete len:202 (+),score=41.69 c8855_g1_i1:25-630(+)